MTLRTTRPLIAVFSRIDREPLGIVVEVRIVPGNRTMAAFAVLREASGRMVRVRGVVVVRLVTKEAVRGGIDIAGRMAEAAIETNMRPGQGKVGLRMVKIGIVPGDG